MPKRKRRASDNWESPKKKTRSSDRTEPNKKKKRNKHNGSRDEAEEGSIVWSIVMTCMIIIAAVKVVMN